MFLQSGEFYWNSGIFVWTVRAIVEAFEKYLPEHHAMFSGVMLANRLPDGSLALNCVAESNDRTAFSISQWTPDRQAPVRRIAAPSKLAAPIVVAPKSAPESTMASRPTPVRTAAA